MHRIKKIGLFLFLAALGTFIALLFASRYEVDSQTLSTLDTQIDAPFKAPLMAELAQLEGEELGKKFSFIPRLTDVFEATNERVKRENALSETQLAQVLMAMKADSSFGLTPESRLAGIALLPKATQKRVTGSTKWLEGKTFKDQAEFDKKVGSAVNKAIAAHVRRQQIAKGKYADLKFTILKASSRGVFWSNRMLFFIGIILIGALGALIYILPAFFDGMPGIKHNHIYHESHTSRGLIGILITLFLVGFYIMLYFYHYVIVEWITLVDPASIALTGNPASQWFMYGFLYTTAIFVMGIRMLTKYRHSRYHQIRTVSVMFFQTAFAFIIPEILVILNQPYMDLKNAWPLNYTFFVDYNISNHISAGTFGIWMLGWGIALTAVGVPLFTYFYGKRWYCSWVCGCGGLAETLGDPFRQLSDKTTEAWQIERFLIHSVLVFAIVMTGLVLYSLFGGEFTLKLNQWALLGITWGVAALLYFLHRRYYPEIKGNKILTVLLVIAGAVTIGTFNGYFTNKGMTLSFNSYDIRKIYGFAIGSSFAGVIGTGLYPILGNRPWCRFGCPLAAYLGLVQRFKSRFRITTNGGQCISCGNCSTYCEMGIDVRAYAQRGQNIVRASCVGCGVCAAVCPRGVLSLENDGNTNSSRMDEVRF